MWLDFSGVDRGTGFLGSASASLGLFAWFPEGEHEGRFESALFTIARVARRVLSPPSVEAKNIPAGDGLATLPTGIRRELDA